MSPDLDEKRKMKNEKKKNNSTQGGETRYVTASLGAIRGPRSTTTTTPIINEEYSALIKALYEFAPQIYEPDDSEEQHNSRSFEIESADVWEDFVAVHRGNVLGDFIEHKIRFWIDSHPRGQNCLLHLSMPAPGHDSFGNVFMTAFTKRLDAIPKLFPDNVTNLSNLRQAIRDTGSDSWIKLKNKQPDRTICFRGMSYDVPGMIFEFGNWQNWDGDKGVKNKAIQYIDDSEGAVHGVLYLGCRDKTIGMIGSSLTFADYTKTKYCDGMLSTYAVEVIPLTSLTDPAFEECLIRFKFAHFGAGGTLFQYLRLEEKDIGFTFTFKEILQIMESIKKDIPQHPLPIIPLSQCVSPIAFEAEVASLWESDEAIQASLFRTLPESPPYCTATADIEGFVEHQITDEETSSSNNSSSDKDSEWKGKAVTGGPLKRSARCSPTYGSDT